MVHELSTRAFNSSGRVNPHIHHARKKCTPFVYGEGNDCSQKHQRAKTNRQKLKTPKKKNEEEIVTERRGCFTSEELL
jgi:hypothetical protein